MSLFSDVEREFFFFSQSSVVLVLQASSCPLNVFPVHRSCAVVPSVSCKYLNVDSFSITRSADGSNSNLHVIRCCVAFGVCAVSLRVVRPTRLGDLSSRMRRRTIVSLVKWLEIRAARATDLQTDSKLFEYLLMRPVDVL